MSLRSIIEAKANVSPPHWLPDNLCYETMMGSVAYAVSNDTSDRDVYGICLPPKDMVFPHLAGEIRGFGDQIKRFEVWQQHHVVVPGADVTYDFQVYGVVKFFQLALENNPNTIDAIFTPRRCVLSSTQVGEYIREHRRDFLTKKSWHGFKGYAYSQMNKIRTKKADPDGKRAALIAEHGYDVKFAYHVVRLLLEGEMILAEHDLDLERHADMLKGIRRGEWTLERLQQWADDKERAMETLYETSTLRYKPDEPLIRRHLIHCLEAHYGDLSAVVKTVTDEGQLLRQIAALTKAYLR